MDIKNDIKKYGMKFKVISTAYIKKIFESNKELAEYCEQLYKQEPQYETVYNVFRCIAKNIELNKCLNCGKTLTYTAYITKKKYCTAQCAHADPNWRLQFKNKVVTKEQLEKSRQTCLKKYGVTNISQLNSIKEKKKQTVLKHFGTEFPMQSKEIMDKSKKTLKEKYNVEHISQVDVIKESKHYKKAIINFKNLNKYSEYVIPNFTFDEYLKNGLNNQSWICVKCGKPFVQKYQYTTRHIKSLSCCPRCLNCYPFISGYSNKEKDILLFIKSIYKGEIIENDKNLIKPYELDIVIPEFKLAIEFNRQLLAF